MTTIVGIQGKNWALIGADTRISDEEMIYQMPKSISKIIEIEEGIYIACAGDLRAINILQGGVKFNVRNQTDSNEQYLTNVFIPALRKVFTNHGYERTQEGVSSTESEFLLAYYGQLYAIGSDYSWIQDSRGLYGLGSGGTLALGALSALAPPSPQKALAKKMATQALDIACAYNADSAPPYTLRICE